MEHLFHVEKKECRGSPFGIPKLRATSANGWRKEGLEERGGIDLDLGQQLSMAEVFELIWSIFFLDVVIDGFPFFSDELVIRSR